MANSTTTGTAHTPSLPPHFHQALPALGTVALISVLSTAALFIFITYRMITWRQHYRAFIGRNQYIVLIYNLAFADLIQALAFSISWHWLEKGEIDSNSNWCFTQGFMINLGDVSSAFFVLAIGLHTWYRVIRNREIQYKTFLGVIAAIWCSAILLTVLAPILKGRHVFTQLEYWCWIPEKYDSERLALHYIWVFIVEFTSFLIYIWIFWHLLTYLRQSTIHNVGRSQASAKRLVWASRAMLAYPVVYTVFTIPLASVRMANYAGHTIPDQYSVLCGCFLISCGWANALTYTLTRRILLKGEFSAATGPFQSIEHGSSKYGTKRSAHLSPSFGDYDKGMSGTNLSNDDLQTKLSNHHGAVLVTCASASDDIDLKPFDEHASDHSHGPLIRIQSPTAVYRTTLSTDEPYEHRTTFSPPNFSRNLHGNTANVEAGSFTPINLNIDGITVTNDIHVASVRHSRICDHPEDEIWSD